MPCDAQTLVTGAQCIQRCVPQGMELSVMIVLAAEAAGIDISTAEARLALVDNAKCIYNCVPTGMLWPAAIALACDIAGE